MSPLEWSAIAIAITVLAIGAAGSVALPTAMVRAMDRLRWAMIVIAALGGLGAICAPGPVRPLAGALFAVMVTLLACYNGRQKRVPPRVVLHYASPSPGTHGRREIMDGMWTETLEPLALYITPQDWNTITAATPEVTAWLERHLAAPNLYRMPATQEAMQILDSLRLYPFLVSSRHTLAIDAFAAALHRPVAPPPSTPSAPASGAKNAAAAAQPDLVLELDDRSDPTA